MADLTLEDLIDLFDEVVDISGIEISEATELGEDLPIDSKEMLRVISRVEAHCRVRFVPRDLLRLRTVGDLLNLAKGQQSAQ